MKIVSPGSIATPGRFASDVEELQSGDSSDAWKTPIVMSDHFAVICKFA